MGSDVSLLGHNIQATHYHGLDGFGDVPDPDAPGLEYAQKEHAVNAIIRIINENPGKWNNSANRHVLEYKLMIN